MFGVFLLLMLMSIVSTSVPAVPNTQYSNWLPFTEERSNYVIELVEGERFQIKTDKKIDDDNDIRWMMRGPETTANEVIGDKSSKSDDAQSVAICPTGYVVTHCEAQSGKVHDECDGVFVKPDDGRVCVAVNGDRGSGAVARAVCSQLEQIADPCNGPNLPKYRNLHSRGHSPSLQCPAGYGQILCNAHSPWRGRLSGQNVDDKGVIPNDEDCALPDCGGDQWCEVTSVCQLIEDSEAYASAVCSTCDGYHCGEGEECVMMDMSPTCVEKQTGCDDTDRCGDKGVCVPIGNDDYECKCGKGYFFSSGSCILVQMRAHSAEVKSGTATTISCVITGITSPITVEWLESGTVISADSNYTQNPGTIENNSQTATLEVKGADVIEDKTFICRVLFPGSLQYENRKVQLNIYDVAVNDAEVKSGTDATISCVMKGITSLVKVEWVGAHGEDNSYTPKSGTLDGDSQTATLEVTGAAVTEDRTFTCRVTSGQFPDSPYSDTYVMMTVYACQKDQYSQFNFETTGHTMKEGGTVTVTCAAGYIPSSDTTTSTTATCGASGHMEFNDMSFECFDENSCKVREQLPQDLEFNVTKDMWSDGETGVISYKCETGFIKTQAARCTEWKCEGGNVKCTEPEDEYDNIITEVEFCKICPPKTYHDSDNNICENCPVGHKSGYGFENCFSKYF
ncbi:uncharacterized protein LOC134823672 [Bolinopsis microptera]|uniref:uncharacterized protein LOC134823672 n=1 Tax=Bolinopsis microptera TaxID=2820187 RepID=UPI00307A8953